MSTSFIDKNRPSLEKQIERFAPLVQKLKNCRSSHEKLEVLDQNEYVKDFLKRPSMVRTFLSGLSPECEVAIKSIIALGQAEKVFFIPPQITNASERLRSLLDKFLDIERFYSEMGGIAGYHFMTLQLLHTKDVEIPSSTYHSFQGIDITKKNSEVNSAIASGIQNMPLMAEIYPVGGAADRLSLKDKAGVPLPAARLSFKGKTLLEGLITDLQAREYLHYKLMGIQLFTPVAMMTSEEKDNHRKILGIFEEGGWFGRPRSLFRFFPQPLVPVLNKEGQWCMQGYMQPLCRPGGHGVIWKLAKDAGIFSWFSSTGRKKALVRQINNPISGVDYGLLAFTGLGCKMDKIFGFHSCPRQTRSNEGTNVLIEKKNDKGFSYTLTNIEYCDFQKYNIIDEPAQPGDSYSKFPSNTNVLFIDLHTISQAASLHPVPGMLVNVKKISFKNEQGDLIEEEIARMESTMQNIADHFEENAKKPLKKEDWNELKTFLTYNERSKTISTTKKAFVLGSSLLETPEGCFLDFLKNARDLLEECSFEVPELSDAAAYLTTGPSFIFLYHPALGPIYSVISQKIRGGKISKDSELQLEIADVDFENLNLEGSLLVHAENLLGNKDEEGTIRYSNQTGKCTLKNVCVRNLGIDRSASNVFWRNEIVRKESCKIVIQGNGEFYAQDVTLEGDLSIIVENGTRVIAENKNGKAHFRKEMLDAPSWHWTYRFGKDQEIILKKENKRASG